MEVVGQDRVLAIISGLLFVMYKINTIQVEVRMLYWSPVYPQIHHGHICATMVTPSNNVLYEEVDINNGCSGYH